MKNLKLTQKIFFIFVLLLFLVVNSWAFTFTTILDLQDSFSEVEEYAFPSVITTAKLKDKVHIALLSVYNYLSTGNAANKTKYQEEFSAAIQLEYDLFGLSQTSTDFEFTQQFNNKLTAIYKAADNLIKLYEASPTDAALSDQLNQLNSLRDDFNTFLETQVTDQISTQIETVSSGIRDTARTILIYVVGVAAIIVLVVIWLIVFISNNITKPVVQLTKAAQAFGQGHFERVDLQRNDELGLFAKTFNVMAENIQASQRALQAELEKTKELDRQKSDFLSIAAHQLRTPMSGIRWATTMLYDGDMGVMSDEQKHHLGNTIENINRMIRLINDLLDVTKIEEQKFKYKFVEQDILPIFNETIKRHEQTAKAKPVNIMFRSKPATGPLLVSCDKEKIELMLNNLLDNAIKYSKPNDTITIEVNEVTDGVNGFVHDTGLGIPKKSHHEVFSKFFRGPNILKVVTEGSGLGLFIVKDIVEKHEGKIWFESEENVGTTFYFHLPKHQVKR
ncbi:MAG: HAMP domain-containing histidine kinase [Candidatus Kerfeldbacteria bacterium]|nr:HAMP domain-containing histidine kinase [Candidatus Kerfeldbacteria bacterium]